MTHHELNCIIAKSFGMLHRILKLPNERLFEFGVLSPNKYNLVQRKTHSKFFSRSLSWDNLPCRAKSIIVIVYQTTSTYEYFIANKTEKLVQLYLDENNITSFNAENILKKELACRTGLGKIAKNSLLHSNSFGFSCKIITLLVDACFDWYDECRDVDYRLDACNNCGECSGICPKGCEMDFKLVHPELCSNYITPDRSKGEVSGPDCNQCIKKCRLTKAGE